MNNADFRNMFEALIRTRQDLENALKAVNHNILRFESKAETPDDLEEKLAISEQNVLDFEKLAMDWKKGYSDLEKKHKIRIMELEQIVEELKQDIEELKDRDSKE